MLAKAICLSINSAITILSLRPPKPSAIKEKSDDVNPDGNLHLFMSKFIVSEQAQIGAFLATVLYLILMAKGFISDELKTWLVVVLACNFSGHLLRIWAYRTLDKFFTYTLMIRQDHQLVQDGPYTYLIHPSYTGLFVAWAACFISLTYEGFWPVLIKPYMPIPIPGLVLMILGLLFCLGVLLVRIQQEEKMLSQHFGSEWEKFVSRRWRFIPFIL